MATVYRCSEMTKSCYLSIITATIGTLCFLCFTWGTLSHFVRKNQEAGGAWVISLLSLLGFGIFLWRTLSQPLSSELLVSCALFAASVGLWAWALATTRARPPTLAFTKDEPCFIFNSGPYRWIRHPFYSAYLLFWIGTATATQGVLGWIVALILGAVYLVAARHEEGKFTRSAIADRYAAYAACTGMFWPQLRSAARCYPF